jgi:hypothetical protein
MRQIFHEIGINVMPRGVTQLTILNCVRTTIKTNITTIQIYEVRAALLPFNVSLRNVGNTLIFPEKKNEMLREFC